MSHFDKQKFINHLNEQAVNLIARGPMYGDSSAQEASLMTLIEIRNFIDDAPEAMHESRKQICKKYKYFTKLTFHDQTAMQDHFSQVLKDWWDLNNKLVKLRCFW